jgi:hypothetical protein
VIFATESAASLSDITTSGYIAKRSVNSKVAYALLQLIQLSKKRPAQPDNYCVGTDLALRELNQEVSIDAAREQPG